MQASVRELKNNLSKYLKLVREGEEIVITSHNRPVARLQATVPPPADLPEIPGVRWRSSKPDFSSNRARPAIEGQTLAEAVLEERR